MPSTSGHSKSAEVAATATSSKNSDPGRSISAMITGKDFLYCEEVRIADATNQDSDNEVFEEITSGTDVSKIFANKMHDCMQVQMYALSQSPTSFYEIMSFFYFLPAFMIALA